MRGNLIQGINTQRLTAGLYGVGSQNGANGMSRNVSLGRKNTNSVVPNEVNGIDQSVNRSSNTPKPQGKCQTCKERKYVDGSNEGNVSFKAPGHISPEASASVVSAHEGEHVSNAVREGNEEGKQLVSASVTLKMAICPECHRSYVSGGVTRTTIAYVKELPYNNNGKKEIGDILKGTRVDERV